MQRVRRALLEVWDLEPRNAIHGQPDRRVGDVFTVEPQRRGNGLLLAPPLACACRGDDLSARDEGGLGRFEPDIARLQPRAAHRSCGDGKILVQCERQREAELGGSGERPVQPVPDEFAQIDDVLTLPRRGQKRLRRLHVEVVEQHVRHRAKQFQQHHSRVGRIEVRPPVRQLRNPRGQFTKQRVMPPRRIRQRNPAHSVHLMLSVAGISRPSWVIYRKWAKNERSNEG
ncbi:MAG: hypothetical protein BWY59_02329 [Verrucomicrobia bacterium ADurb.Bin345]|nr:MAG: hypothetical protein BWY59_02329 [Verrucomicrobia bacterium ADurb.Bin345]